MSITDRIITAVPDEHVTDMTYREVVQEIGRAYAAGEEHGASVDLRDMPATALTAGQSIRLEVMRGLLEYSGEIEPGAEEDGLTVPILIRDMLRLAAAIETGEQ